MTTECNGFGCYTDPVDNMGKCRTDCRTDPECAIRRYCEIVPADSGVDGGSVSSCPAQFPQGHLCTRNTQCLTGTCSDGVCCDKNCDKCGSCNTPGSVGTCIPIPAGTDPEKECMNNQSDPTGLCAGLCNGQARCTYPKAGATCGTCKACDGSGLCNQMPADDVICGTIDCDGLNVTGACKHYSDLTTSRCASPGVCKMANMVSSCTVFTDTCPTDGGSTGTGGTSGTGGTTGTGGATGAGGRGGTTGTAGAGTGTAGTSATGTGGAGAKSGGGGGGCCAIGGGERPTGPVALLIFAAVLVTRRRRR
jgi:MYXO-CTERM domain-containing protein